MNGLFGNFLNPENQGLLGASAALLQAGGPSRTPVGFGQALGQGLMGGMHYNQQAQEQKNRAGLFDLKMLEAQREEAARKEHEAALVQLAADPRFADLGPLLRVAPAAAIERALPRPKAAEPFTLKPGEVRYDEKGKPIVSAPDKPDKEAAKTELAKLLGERDALEPNDPSRPLYDAKIKKLTEQTPPITIQNLPVDKRFEWEDKLRADYKGDVKAFREVEDAHRIIKGALENASPANDLAAATKFMKLLDPTSVVRESELAMAIQASGLWDRIMNYHNVLLQGVKLTPQQREDFRKAADLIYSNVQKKWGEIDGLYDSAAKDYGLDPKRIKMGGGSRANQSRIPKYDPATGTIK